MSQKIFSALFVLILVFSISHASAESVFTNELDIADSSLSFVIHESYTGIDADTFRQGLDRNKDSIVNSSEVETFNQDFVMNRAGQYRGYIVIDDGNIYLEQHSFEIEISGAEGEIGTSDVMVTVSAQYNMSSSISSGKHSVWILGHPLIKSMSISLPKGVQLADVDGIDELRKDKNNGRIQLEGRSGIRSFVVDGRQTFEYAVLISTYKSSFIADLSAFPSFFK